MVNPLELSMLIDSWLQHTCPRFIATVIGSHKVRVHLKSQERLCVGLLNSVGTTLEQRLRLWRGKYAF